MAKPEFEIKFQGEIPIFLKIPLLENLKQKNRLDPCSHFDTIPGVTDTHTQQRQQLIPALA